MSDKNFKFEFSLEVLNHLGRGLYRSFSTVIAEAVSNSWDAEATKVEITFDKDRDILIIKDNGEGMNSEDFQGKFLKIGYTRRKGSRGKTERNVIGRKGIGKLALLSVSKKITIITKKNNNKTIAEKIDNTKLDIKIEKKEKEYILESVEEENLETQGTSLIFEDLKTNFNDSKIIKKYLATQFNFIFNLAKEDTFEIFVNDEKVTEKDLKELNDNTQFIWFLECKTKEIENRFENLRESRIIEETNFEFENKKIEIKGFIASVEKPSHLALKGSDEIFKAGINLFCSGRLRQENLFQEITSKSVVEEYLYGEVHVDGFEDEKIDRFTSSREGIIKSDPLYQKFLLNLKKIQSQILKDWDSFRVKNKEEGDIENTLLMPKYERRLLDSQNWRRKDFKKEINEKITDKEIKNDMKQKLEAISYKNIQIYQDFFIMENLFREYLKKKNFSKEEDLKNFLNEVKEEFSERYKNSRGVDLNSEEYKHIEEVVKSLKNTKGNRIKDAEFYQEDIKIVKEETDLNYVGLFEMGEIVDYCVNKIQENNPAHNRRITSRTNLMKPIRNPLMHTNELTKEVLEYKEIKNLISYIGKLK